MNGKSWWKWGILGIFGVILVINGVSSLDPDFGWHIRIGEIMMKNGIPKTDPFSYTMPSFPWVDHGRLSDVVMAWLYPKLGMTGLAIIFALMVVTAVMVVLPIEKVAFGVVPLFLGWGVLVARFGVRPQVEDWLFAAILIRWGNEEKWWKKGKWAIPVLFILWANFHGGWLVGLGILLILVWGKGREDLVVWAVALLATGLNPYGFRLWGEIWLTVSDTGLRSAIVEWQPFYARAELGIWLFSALVISFIKIFKSEVAKRKLALVSMLFLAGLSSLRNMPFFFLGALPVATDLMEKMYLKVKKDKIMWGRAKKFYAILIGISVILVIVEVVVPTIRSMNRQNPIYPDKAVKYLHKNQIGEGQLFSDYGWGGYLIWKLPERKVFIDGRMPSWRFVAPDDQSENAFSDYKKIVAEGDYLNLFEKFNIRTVLWSKSGSILNYSRPIFNIDEWGWFNLLAKKAKKGEGKNFIDELVKGGWKKTYDDGVAVIYSSPASTN
jgi:hypothetical protein